MARYVASQNLRQFFYLVEDEFKDLPESPQTDKPLFRIVGVRLWHDGSPYAGSIQTSAPYLDSPLARKLGIPPGSHGEAKISAPALAERIKTYSASGWQVTIHSQGDNSNREEAAAIALAGLPPSQRPLVRVEHGVMMPNEFVQQFAALNITPSVHINHILGIACQAGTLEAGKWADFQIVDRIPYAVPPQELSQTKTLGVFVAGHLNYGTSSFAK